MRFQVEIGGRMRDVSVERHGAALGVTLDGMPANVEVLPVGGGRLSLRFPDTGRQHDVVVARGQNGDVEVLVGGLRIPGRLRPAGWAVKRAARSGDAPERVVSPMPGKVVKLLVRAGDRVTARQGVIVVEAMKMENELRAGREGVVREVLVDEGASVDAGTPLVVIT
jgi:glutaconyl-CoA/methylmalonyl-CoA decarboxylase subunit gamma